MTRPETTKFLSDLLVSTRLKKRGTYYASEVSLDWGTDKVKFIDYLQFCPASVTSTDGIEKGKFICYEVKSCLEDVFSGNGLNFIGEQNYLVMTMQTWKETKPYFLDGRFWKHLHDTNPESSGYIGIMCAVPDTGRTAADEYENPTPLDAEESWKLEVIMPCRNGPRNRSMTQLLFYMLRSGK